MTVKQGPSRAETGVGTRQAPLSLRRRARATGLSSEVVILTRDSAEELDQSLTAIRQAAAAGGADLLNIDLGSADSTRDHITASLPGGRAVWLRRDDGLTDALEAAAGVSTADILVVVESSLMPVTPAAVVGLLEHLAEHSTTSAVAPARQGGFAIRRLDLLEILEGPERRILTQSDLFLELVLQGRQVQDLDSKQWQELPKSSFHGTTPGILPPPRSRPVVLHVAECFAAGTERHVLDLVRYLEDFKHVLAVPSHHHGRSTETAIALAEEAGARVERVEMGRSWSPHRHAQALAAVRRLVRQCDPDIVHGHSSIGGALARLATVGLPVPVVYTPHAVSRSRWALAVERGLRGRTARTIAVSNSERDFMLAHGVAGPGQLAVIPNGIDLASPPPLSEPLRARLGVPTDAPLIGYVGRLAWQKAPEVFVAACAIVRDRLPGAHFVLIGSGPLRSQVELLVAETGAAQQFHLIPSLLGAAAALEELDVYALPSRFEGGPYTPMEAMRAGTPVVVTNVAGNRDVVEHGVSGMVVPQDEPHALAVAMLTVLEDAALRARLVEGARESLHRFEVRTMAEATSSLYLELCQPYSAPVRQGNEDLGVLAHAALPRELPDAVKAAGR